MRRKIRSKILSHFFAVIILGFLTIILTVKFEIFSYVTKENHLTANNYSYELLPTNNSVVLYSLPQARTRNESKESSFKSVNSLRQKYSILNGHRVPGINCGRAVVDDKIKVPGYSSYSESVLNVNITNLLLEAAANKSTYCERFIKQRSYIMEPLSEEEAEFSIAYSMLIYTDIERFERLLRAIYRPQNVYCVHLDLAANESFHREARTIIDCFPNVFVPPRIVRVVHSYFTVLEAEIVCMEALLAYSKAWKYFINLTGQEFPLKTNLGIVRILKIFNGANSIAGSVKNSSIERYKGRAPPPGINITLTKGSVHITACRKFVEFIIYNKSAQIFLNWTRDTYVPDETFFSSLNHSPQLGVPGAYLGVPEIATGKYIFVTRFKNWYGDFHDSFPCGGQYVRGICIFGTRDLPMLASRYELFANKFFKDYQPHSYNCMEELLFNRTVEELQGINRLNMTFYRELSFVNNHVGYNNNNNNNTIRVLPSSMTTSSTMKPKPIR